MDDMHWTTQAIDLNKWLCVYAKRRFGFDNPDVCHAWQLMRSSVLHVNTTRLGEQLFTNCSNLNQLEQR